MKKYTFAKVIENKEIALKIYDMYLYCPEIAKEVREGQFINIYLERKDLILPRPISICEIDKEKGILRIIYQIAGKGTLEMSLIPAESTIKISGPFGNGFMPEKGKNIAVIGGGVGVPPLLALSKRLLQDNDKNAVKVFTGFRSKDHGILEEEFKALGIENYISTDDGSQGFHGNALQCFKDSGFKADLIYACGPSIMLQFIAKYAEEANIDAYLSFEERMACGFGTCVCCAIKIKNASSVGYEYKKVCKDGPVFLSKEVFWDA